MGGMFAYYASLAGSRVTSSVPSTSGPNGVAPRAVVALGTLEPRDGIVQISSPLVGYQIQQVHVQEGQLVQAGDLLIELDPTAAQAEQRLAEAQLSEARDRQQTEVAIAKEKVATAQLAVDQSKAGKALELAAAQSRIGVTASKLKQADKDMQRLEDLHKLPEPLASQQQVEHQQVLREAAAAEHEAAQVALKRLEQTLVFQQQTAEAELRGATQALRIAEKGAGIESLQRRVELAGIKLAQTKITAANPGVVLGVSAHAGEVVAQQPLLQLGDLDHLVCVAEVDAGDVPLLSANHAATVRCRAFHEQELDGTVDRIGNQVSPALLRPLDPRKPVDRNVTKVIVQIDSKKAAKLINTSSKDRRAALVGLQVEVEFPASK